MNKLYSVEVASALKEKNIIELSEKVKANTLQADDKEAVELIDNFAREIGNTGKTPENTYILSELIKKTVEPMVFQPDQSILYDIFDVGYIGEFDEKIYSGLPKNTIKVYDSNRGGNVPASYVDPNLFKPVKISLQAETEINYSDLRRNGFKSIARLTEMARESFEAEMFYRLFVGIDAALDFVSGDQKLNAGSALTPAVAEASARYLRDMSDGDPFMVGLSKYIDSMSRMSGFEAYLSEEMKNELNRIGRLAMFDGVRLVSIPTARKTPSGHNLIPDKRIFGIAGKIGEADIRGEMRVYETYDNDAEKVRLKFTGFEFEYAIYYLDKLARIDFA